MTAHITKVEFVDYGVHGEYGSFGKVIASTTVPSGDTPAEVAERKAEIAEVHRIVGEHCGVRYVEVIPAVATG